MEDALSAWCGHSEKYRAEKMKKKERERDIIPLLILPFHLVSNLGIYYFGVIFINIPLKKMNIKFVTKPE